LERYSNLGVYFLISGDKGGINYLVTKIRKRERSNILVTPFQGYAGVKNEKEGFYYNLVRGMMEELAEEFLCVDENNRIMGFKFKDKNVIPHFVDNRLFKRTFRGYMGGQFQF